LSSSAYRLAQRCYSIFDFGLYETNAAVAGFSLTGVPRTGFSSVAQEKGHFALGSKDNV
jgi:hypothetical protein